MKPELADDLTTIGRECLFCTDRIRAGDWVNRDTSGELMHADCLEEAIRESDRISASDARQAVYLSQEQQGGIHE